MISMSLFHRSPAALLTLVALCATLAAAPAGARPPGDLPPSCLLRAAPPTAAAQPPVVGREDSTRIASALWLPPFPVETGSPDRPFDPGRVDPWLGFDKVQHLTFSFLLTVGGQYTLVNKGAWAETRALPLSAAAAAAVGVAKEVYDARQPRSFFSRRDLVADALGIALAAGFILL